MRRAAITLLPNSGAHPRSSRLPAKKFLSKKRSRMRLVPPFESWKERLRAALSSRLGMSEIERSLRTALALSSACDNREACSREEEEEQQQQEQEQEQEQQEQPGRTFVLMFRWHATVGLAWNIG